MATCYRHPSRETGVSCSNCGNPICPDCMTATPVGMRCPDCAKQKTQVRRGAAAYQASTDINATWALLALNVLAYFGSHAGISFTTTGLNATAADGVLLGYGFPDLGVAEGEVWRLLTGGFLHAGPLHLAFNMFGLWSLGQLLEPALGKRRYVGLYFAALFAGSAAVMAFDVEQPTVGASAALFGLMGAAFVYCVDRGIPVGSTGIPQTILLNLFITFLIPFISVAGHLGGLVGGAIAMFLIDKLPDRKPGLQAAAAAGLAAAFAIAGVALAMVMAPDAPPGLAELLPGR